MSSLRDAGEMEAMHARAVESAIETNCESRAPIALLLAHRVFDLVSKFVGYGFCRSHAAAFARTVYQSSHLNRLRKTADTNRREPVNLNEKRILYLVAIP